MDLVRYSPLDPPAHRCDAVAIGDVIHVAGLVATDLNGTVQEQARDVLAKIDTVLAEAESDKSRLAWASVWLADMDDFEAFNEVWLDWIVPGKAPARACTGVDLRPGVKVEVAVVAAK